MPVLIALLILSVAIIAIMLFFTAKLSGPVLTIVLLLDVAIALLAYTGGVTR